MTRPPVLRSQRSSAPLLVGVTGALGVGLVAVVDPNEAGNYPTCPFLAFTGLQCPGCGTLRVVHALVRGDVAGAVDLNVVAVLLLPLLAWAWWQWLVTSLRGRPREPMLPAAAGYAIALVLAVFGVLRNLPWFAPLAA